MGFGIAGTNLRGVLGLVDRRAWRSARAWVPVSVGVVVVVVVVVFDAVILVEGVLGLGKKITDVESSKGRISQK